jgi:hypothetical protein
LFCVFNLGAEAASYTLQDGAGETVFELGDVKRQSAELSLGARAGVIVKNPKAA